MSPKKSLFFFKKLTKNITNYVPNRTVFISHIMTHIKIIYHFYLLRYLHWLLCYALGYVLKSKNSPVAQLEILTHILNINTHSPHKDLLVTIFNIVYIIGHLCSPDKIIYKKLCLCDIALLKYFIESEHLFFLDVK